jgi:hypothetical protein
MNVATFNTFRGIIFFFSPTSFHRGYVFKKFLLVSYFIAVFLFTRLKSSLTGI